MIDVLGRLRRQTPKYVGEIRERLDAIELAGFDQAVDDGSPFTALVAAGKEIILAAQRNAAYGALGAVVINIELPILKVTGERCLASERVLDGLRERALRRQASTGRFQPGLELIQDRLGLGLATLAFDRWGFVADRLLDGIQALDPREPFGGGGRIALCGNVVEFPPRMRPTRHFPYPASGIQVLVAGIGVGLQVALVVRQETSRSVFVAGGGVLKDHHRGLWLILLIVAAASHIHP